MSRASAIPAIALAFALSAAQAAAAELDTSLQGAISGQYREAVGDPVETAPAAAHARYGAPSGQYHSESPADVTVTQTQPTNINVSVRIFSPGDDGAVTQVNHGGAQAPAQTVRSAPAPDTTPARPAPVERSTKDPVADATSPAGATGGASFPSGTTATPSPAGATGGASLPSGTTATPSPAGATGGASLPSGTTATPSPAGATGGASLPSGTTAGPSSPAGSGGGASVLPGLDAIGVGDVDPIAAAGLPENWVWEWTSACFDGGPTAVAAAAAAGWEWRWSCAEGDALQMPVVAIPSPAAVLGGAIPVLHAGALADPLRAEPRTDSTRGRLRRSSRPAAAEPHPKTASSAPTHTGGGPSPAGSAARIAGGGPMPGVADPTGTRAAHASAGAAGGEPASPSPLGGGGLAAGPGGLSLATTLLFGLWIAVLISALVMVIPQLRRRRRSGPVRRPPKPRAARLERPG